MDFASMETAVSEHDILDGQYWAPLQAVSGDRKQKLSRQLSSLHTTNKKGRMP